MLDTIIPTVHGSYGSLVQENSILCLSCVAKHKKTENIYFFVKEKNKKDKVCLWYKYDPHSNLPSSLKEQIQKLSEKLQENCLDIFDF